MTEKFQRTVEVENERVNAPGSPAETAGLRVRFEKARYQAIQRGETPPTLEDLGTERLDILRKDDDREALIAALRGEAAGMASMTITEKPAAKAESVAKAVPCTAEATEKRELTPEDAAATLAALEVRFLSPEHLALHKGVEWTRVKKSLEANPAALWSINKMQAAGHDPGVYDFDGEGFDIGTCSEESPASGRNCVYDAKAAEWLKANRPGEKFSGSAVEMAKAMGIGLMNPDKYKERLQAKGAFDLETWSYLLTNEATRDTGCALDGSRGGDVVYVSPYRANFHFDRRAWRGSLRVKWAA